MKESKIIDLEKKLIKHKRLYYQGEPEISDFEYDKLENELRSISPESYALEIVGSDYFSSEKIEHEKKMLSLNKTYKLDELKKWIGNRPTVGMFKIDGSSCSLIYENKRLLMAKTRGDGRFGENISDKAFFIPTIPKNINSSDRIEIRGEVYCNEENFFKLSEEMLRRELDKPSNLRNIVAGILGRKENVDLAGYLSFQAFEVIGLDDVNTETDKFRYLKQETFETPEIYKIKSDTDISTLMDHTKDFFSNGNYLVDGIVFTYDDVSLHDELGETAHHPRYKMAFKFQGETKSTSIMSISWQVSRNGILTPVANVEQVELSGAKVSRVTLHNYGMVEQNQLKAGDKIEVVRSGEVIPKFLQVLEHSDSNFEVPSTCPSCGQEIFKEEIRLVCKNKFCPAQVQDQILNFIQKMNIEDLSSKRLEELIRLKIVNSIESLYNINVEDLLSVDKVKDKLANKIITNIENSKRVDLITFLSALGLTGGAYNKCEKIVNAGFDSIDKVLSLSVEELMSLEGFAEKSSVDLVASVQKKKDLIINLLSLGVDPVFVKKELSSSNIEGKKFCITGSLSMKRSDLQKLIKDNGGQSVSSVTAKTDYLITNDEVSSSSKFKKAQELNIPIINESFFLGMIDGKN